MERLTKKNQASSKAFDDMSKDCTFTPKINKKSKILDEKRGKGSNRYQQLHKLVTWRFPLKINSKAESYQMKKDQLKREKEMKISKDESECAFQPELVTNYTPEFVNDLSFVERSHL